MGFLLSGVIHQVKDQQPLIVQEQWWRGRAPVYQSRELEFKCNYQLVFQNLGNFALGEIKDPMQRVIVSPVVAWLPREGKTLKTPEWKEVLGLSSVILISCSASSRRHREHEVNEVGQV